MKIKRNQLYIFAAILWIVLGIGTLIWHNEGDISKRASILFIIVGILQFLVGYFSERKKKTIE